jgi:DNA mismatch repair protein MutS2
LIEQETFHLLDWQRLCQHLATFAATKLGVIAAENLVLPQTIAETKQLLAQTQEVYRIETSLNPNWSFNGIYDIGNCLERARIRGILTAEELLNLATTLAGVRKLRRVIEDLEESPTLQALVSELKTFPELEKEIHYCIDDRAKITERASPELGSIRQKIKSLRSRIQQTLQNIIQKQSNALQEFVITQRGDRFVLPVKASHSGQIVGIVHDTSSSGSTLYLEPKAVVELGNQLQTSRNQETREEEKILRQLTEKVAEVCPDLVRLLAVATALDLATAKARYSLWLSAHPPEFINFQGGESIYLRQLRHPLLVWQEKHEQGHKVVPIDVLIQPETRVVAITGPNTGGKTVTLKTLGLAVLMAKVGLFIPAQETVKIPWFESVLADIGDEQSLEQNLSTFSGHISRIIRILKQIERKNSLVLLDEIGAGTDPSEGTAIAIAILKYLAEHNLLTIATTHYGELKTLKYNDARFENASVEFDDVSLQPTYRLLWGIPGRSNAITIAQRLGLPDTIISDAKELVGNFSQDVNHLIAELEKQRREQELKHQQAQELLTKTEEFYRQVEDKAYSLQARERDLKQEQEKAVQKMLLDAKSQIGQVIKELQQKGNPTAQSAQQARETLTKIGDRFLTPIQQSKAKSSYKPKIGERVRITSIGQTGEVLDLDEDGEQLTVRFGLMKMVIPLTEVESLEGKRWEATKTETNPPVPQTKPQSNSFSAAQSNSQGIKVRTTQNTLDIRGKRVHLAYPLLEKAIASATEIGILWIVHGKGTGSLRQGVHEFLQNHPQVRHFELAPAHEGGAGVTIAYL